MTTFLAGADLLRAVADHLWQSTLCVAAAALLAGLTRRTHPRAQIWIWLAASVKFWVPFAALIALGSWGARQVPVSATLDAARVAPYVVVQVVSEPFAGTAAALDAGMRRVTDTAFPWMVILGGLWACGALVISERWLRRWRRVARLVAEAQVAVIGREVDALVRASAAMGLGAPPRIALTTASLEPGILGVTRTTLLWPVGLSEHLDDEQLYAVMLHEVSHARRRDNVMAAAHMVAEIAFWFYPLVWWVGSRLVDARELACDEDVVRLSRAPSAYAASLLKTCEYCLASPLECVPGVTGSELRGRIEAIMHSRVLTRLTLWRKALVTGVIAVSLVAPIAAGSVKGAVTDVWRSAFNVPEAPARPGISSPVLSPSTPSLGDVFRLAAVPFSSPKKVIEAVPAAPALASSQSPSIGDTGAAQPVDAFRIGAPKPARPRATPPDPPTDPEILDAFRSGQTYNDLTLSLTVNFRQLNAAEYLVPVSIRIAPSRDLVVGRGRTSRLDFLVEVKDINGITYENLRDAVDLVIGPASIADLATKPIIYDAAFTLLPGRYKVKVLSRDQATGRIGTSEAAFTIPNLDKQQRAQ
jgi:beta-lactamase regulating signal transducer with metallopeptidase domain